MQSRRHEDFTQSPASKLRAPNRLEMGSDPYNGTRRDVLDRSPRDRRSVSPHRLDGSRWAVNSKRTSGSIERRDYGWHLGGGSGTRSVRGRSRSPPFEQLRKRDHFNEGCVQMHRDYDPSLELRRQYGPSERADYKVDDDSSKLKRVYGYEHSTSRISKEDFNESRFSAGGGHGMLDQKSMAMEDDIARGSYRLPQDLGPTSNYVETGGRPSSSSRSVDIRRVEHERVQYRDPIASDKLPVMEPYNDGDKPIFRSRDMSYPMVSASHSKDFASTSPLKELVSSSRMLRSEFYHDGINLPPSDEFSRSSRKLTDPIGLNAYGQRQVIGSAGDPEAGQRNLTYYQRGAYSPTRTEHDDYSYPKIRETANDDCGYSSHDLHRMMTPCNQLDYDRARTDYDHRDSLSRSSILQATVNRVGTNNEDSYGNPQKGIILDHPTLQKQTVSVYLDTNRTSNASNLGEDYMGSGYGHFEFGMGVSQDYEISHLGAQKDHQISHLRSDYGFGRNAGPKFLKERLQSSPVSKYSSEMHRNAVRRQKMEEFSLNEPSHRVPKRKYIGEEEISVHDSRRIISNKWNAPRELQDPYDSGEEWINEDASGLYSSGTVGFDQKEYRKAGRRYDGLDHRGDFACDDWLSSQNSVANTQRHSVGLYKHGGRYIKGYTKTGSLSSYNLHHFDRRSGLHKHRKVWKKSDDDQEDVHENDDDPSEDWVGPAESEPSEDSDEFKQLVHEAFLKYSKKLNVKASVRRRYKEQGKAGSLFCIVCGRSFSKEFMDTQRLVTHAFMSHKVGLRAQHLGLHKAICVLLGWNTVVPHDTVTWVPEVMPDAEALTQKEDLILWPPLIIIHNISMSDNNPRKWKVVTIEEIEAFLRGKGFVRGRIKVSLGSPADQSIMVVKFLTTFSGLGDAERLHRYFVENKHGRVDFEQVTSNNGQSNNSLDAGIQGDKVEEHILYGYMGIAEDLDKVDFNNRKLSYIKSKKEIQDLANAPIRPDER